MKQNKDTKTYIQLAIFFVILFGLFLVIARPKLWESLTNSTNNVYVSPSATPNTQKLYINKKYHFEIQYPPNLNAADDSVAGTNVTDIEFPSNSEGDNLPSYTISVIPYPNDTKDDTQLAYDKILALQVDAETDADTTSTIGGAWNQETNYKRLSDETVNGLTFFVIDNPKGYGGSNRRLLLVKDGLLYVISGLYNGDKELETFKQFYSSFKFDS